MSFKIYYDLKTITCSSTGVVYGDISIDVNSFQFPDRKWDDFIVHYLGMWLYSLWQLKNGHLKANFVFMEGTYNYRATRVGNDLLKIECFEDDLKSRTIENVNFEKFASEIIDASTEVLKFISIQDWHLNKDWKALKMGIEDLR